MDTLLPSGRPVSLFNSTTQRRCAGVDRVSLITSTLPEVVTPVLRSGRYDRNWSLTYGNFPSTGTKCTPHWNLFVERTQLPLRVYQTFDC